jgi:hypothetical protein
MPPNKKFKSLFANRFYQLPNGTGDPIFDVARPTQRGAAVLVQVGAAFVAAFRPYTAARM